ncbi:NAD-dependent epimerase/dehydratase family protein [Flavobacterium sp.]|uniref:NAD-dependent epimerase/dehydratase family protein n=1 Tax=Flavobacterium sp. TaxID=239 RepID=UPI00261C94BB|nr:NAD-dependent epimerase/dehydratase family protein [Flavobacterium sp.]
MVLVTGATGLVGSHLLLRLAQEGRKVRALYRDDAGIEKVRNLFSMYQKEAFFDVIEWCNADITEVPSLHDAFSGITLVYHCAAMISFDPADEEALRKVNIEGTANIVNFSLSNNVRKICYVSSIAALGDLNENEHIVSETTEWNAERYHSDYAISKYGAEMEVWRGQQEGLEVVIVNPGVIIGPYAARSDWQQGSGKIFSELSSGLKYYTKGTTGFIGVWDVASVMHWLMEHDIKGERFTLIAENVSFDQLSLMISEALQCKPPHVYAKKWLTEVAWRLDWFLSLLSRRRRRLSKATARSLHAKELYDNKKIVELSNFSFEPMAQVIKKTALYFNLR